MVVTATASEKYLLSTPAPQHCPKKYSSGNRLNAKYFLTVQPAQ